jgi:hypothetical protein
MSVQSKPQIEAYIGMTGSGKGVSIDRRLAELKRPRLLVWDPRDEYDSYARKVTSLVSLTDALRKAGRGGFKLRFVPGGAMDLKQSFAVVCRLSFACGDMVYLAEELSDVTLPSWAPPAWKQIITQGRHRSLVVMGCAQRPALVDKNFLGNATVIRVFMLGDDNDIKTMAKTVRAPESVVADLTTTEHDDDKGADIQFLEYTRRTRTLLAGEMTVRQGRGITRYETRPFVVGEPQKPAAPVRKKRRAT